MKKIEIVKKVGIILSVIIILFVCINFIPTKKVVSENVWRASESKQTLICAERGGYTSNPENTKKAFNSATTYADIIEIDIRTSKDNELVIINDESVNRLALAEDAEVVYVNDCSLSELRKYNLGANFVSTAGNKPYASYSITTAQSQGLTIMTFTEFLELFLSKTKKYYYIDIKESGDLGKKAVDQIVEILKDEKYVSYEKHILLMSENEDIVNYIVKTYPDQPVGAMGKKTNSFIVMEKFGFGLFSNPQYLSIHVNMKQKVGLFNMNLAKKSFINKVHGKNMAITYWNVDNEEDMKELIDLGADVIATGDCKTLYDLLDEKDYR